MSDRSGRPVGALPLLVRPWVAVAVPVAGVAAAGWALWLVLPTRDDALGVFIGAFGVVAVAKVAWRDADDKAVVRALVTHADPGPRLRARTAVWARAALHPRGADRWGPLVVVVALAVACVLVAAVRASWPVALPAPFLLGVGAATDAARRASMARAARWLDDPPVPAEGPG